MSDEDFKNLIMHNQNNSTNDVSCKIKERITFEEASSSDLETYTRQYSDTDISLSRY